MSEARDGDLYCVSYFEALPGSAAAAAALLGAFAARCRGMPGNRGYDGFQEITRPERFAIVEAWHDPAALTGRSADADAFTRSLEPLLAAPPDPRPSLGLDLAAVAEDPGTPSAVHVLTHVDIVPPAKDDALALLAELAPASRGEVGNRRFDVLQQHNRANHLTLVEAWRDGKALEVHLRAAHTRRFRDRLQPLQGALYDERLYWLLR